MASGNHALVEHGEDHELLLMGGVKRNPASIAKAVLNLVKKGFAIDQTARLDIGFGLRRSGLYQA